MLRNKEKNMRSMRLGKELIGWVRIGSKLVWQHPPYIEIYPTANTTAVFHVTGADMSNEESLRLTLKANAGPYFVDFTAYEQPLKDLYIQSVTASKVIFNLLDLSQIKPERIISQLFYVKNIVYNKCLMPKNENYELFISVDAETVEFLESPIIDPSQVGSLLGDCPNLKKIDLSNLRITIRQGSNPFRGWFIRDCPLLEEIDISSVDIEEEFFMNNVHRGISGLDQLFAQIRCPKLKKITLTTYVWYSIYYHCLISPTTMLSRLPTVISNAFSDLMDESKVQVALQQLKKGTHPVFKITDIAERPEIWDEI